ncbi:polysaccharide deacetylase family protein [Psychrobacillus sp. NEAU-3TGS]|uniref:polysaccharide deacetylase family protein n=1 Tax=Psychrobacillus sp. NEAU-3TGS TaxID=2995412 RepID=UPI0024978882|nr:polysaccharide deacetylase family protein [Psychrobacillus sp. NEAU-3TGS]MDI2587656.1 polysaccharide deacetylase family protein [Psychrobacillus sp. NEAU-3TGS]
MITIYQPRKFDLERSYIINVLFGEFLGLDYEIQDYEGQDYKIVLANKSVLFIQDSFFSYQKEDDYLKVENIPSTVGYGNNRFIVEKDIPIVYGTNHLEVTANQIVCGIDIFAASFFMLTRWEEYVNKARDMYNRFSGIFCVAFKNDFLDRPIVNEYVEMLWNMLTLLGIEQKRKEHKFEFIMTHDVDSIKYWKDINKIARIFGGDLIKRKSIPTFFKHLIELPQVKLGKRKDPFDTFDYIMDLSEAANIKSRFYFMSGGLTKFDNDYRIDELDSLDIIQRVKQRGHVIGFHPSFNTYNDPLQWKKEKDRLEEVLGFRVKEGRQHYLRFETPVTWNIWDDNGMEMDCTLCYADREGFRCGTCYEFPIFDFINRKQLKLKEFPLIAMEISFSTYQTVSPHYMEEKMKILLEKTKKYNGNFVFLWHNSNFKESGWKLYQPVYENVLKLQMK